MAVIDHRAPVAATRIKGRRATAGYYRVEYRDAKGRTHNATCIGAGSSSGLKLQVREYGASKTIDNVPAATAKTQTGVYFART